MKSIYYKATNGYLDRIEAVEVERETDSFIWIDGRREAKGSRWSAFFKTFQEAKYYLIRDAMNALHDAERRIERAKERLSQIEKLNETTEQE